MKSLVLSLLFAMTASQAQAQMACRSIFGDGLVFSTSSFSLENQNSKGMIPVLTAKILSMSADTLAESIGPKITSEKGKITLGKKLEEGWSVELEYAQDLRQTETIYRLSEISLVKPNGEKAKISKSPTSIDGLEMSKLAFNSKDLQIPEGSSHPFNVIQEIEAPAFIRGPLWNNLNKWIPYIEFLNRSKLREASESNLLKLKSEAVLKSNIDYTKKIIRKQAFKFALLGALMYTYANRSEIVNLSNEKFNKLLDNSEFKNLNNHEHGHFTGQLRKLLPMSYGTLDIPAAGKKNRISEKLYLELSDILKTALSAGHLEQAKGGEELVYLFKDGKTSELNKKKIMKLLSEDSEEESLLIYFYPATKKIIFVAPGLVIGDSELKFFTFAVDGETDSILYNTIKARLSPSERKSE